MLTHQIGFVTYSISPVEDAYEDEGKPQPTIMQGYELLVTATVDGKRFGATKLRMSPGDVPPLRLRATPVLAAAGDEIAIELIRGPGFSGEVPDEVAVDHLGDRVDIAVDADSRSASYRLPADADDAVVFHAGTALDDGKLRVTGGRVLCVTALGDSAKLAQQRAYDAMRGIHIDGVQYRRDIGHRAIKR